MQKKIKFIVAAAASFCCFYLVVLIAKTYAWATLPFVILFISLLWKKDRITGMGAFTALLVSLIGLAIVLYILPGIKTGL